MMGLLQEERDALTLEATYPDATIDRLVERGLQRLAYIECFDCRSRDQSCRCRRFYREVFETTPTGHLALRLDAAARAMGAVSA